MNNNNFLLYYCCIFLPMMVVLMDDDLSQREEALIDRMTAPTVEQAIESGLEEGLAPYFNVCTDEAGITAEMAGDYTESVLDRAEEAEQCMTERKQRALQP